MSPSHDHADHDHGSHDHESHDHESHDHADHDHANHGGTDADLAELLDLDGQVLHFYWTDALTWSTGALTGGACARILDLGAGTGTGTIALAQRFPDAHLIAVDNSADMLTRIAAKATNLGLAPRIQTIHADLDHEWPKLDPIDLTWASMSMHHMGDPDQVLAHVFAATRPGGVLAVTEFAEPPRFLPEDPGFGRAGLEKRCLDAVRQEHAESLPELGSAWSPRLAAAGFTDVDEHVISIDLLADSSAALAYARGWLQRLHSATADRLDPQDQEALGELLDGGGLESLQRQGELTIRGTRTLTVGRRPRN